MTKWTTRNNNRTDNNSRSCGEAFEKWSIRNSLIGTSVSPASSNRRHYRNSITVLNCRGLFLQVADVFVIQVNVDERTEFAVVGVKMPAQVRVLGNQPGQGFRDGAGLDLDRGLLAGVLAQRGGYVDFCHAGK